MSCRFPKTWSELWTTTAYTSDMSRLTTTIVTARSMEPWHQICGWHRSPHRGQRSYVPGHMYQKLNRRYPWLIHSSRYAPSQAGSASNRGAPLAERLRLAAAETPRLSPSSQGGEGAPDTTAARLAAVMASPTRQPGSAASSRAAG